jgi:hypothetical protein
MKLVRLRICVVVTSTVLVPSSAVAQYYGARGAVFNNIYGAQASLGVDRLRANMAREDFLKKMGRPEPAAPRQPVSGKYQPTGNFPILERMIQSVTSDASEQKILRDLTAAARTQVDVATTASTRAATSRMPLKKRFTVRSRRRFKIRRSRSWATRRSRRSPNL